MKTSDGWIIVESLELFQLILVIQAIVQGYLAGLSTNCRKMPIFSRVFRMLQMATAHVIS